MMKVVAKTGLVLLLTVGVAHAYTLEGNVSVDDRDRLFVKSSTVELRVTHSSDSVMHYLRFFRNSRRTVKVKGTKRGAELRNVEIIDRIPEGRFEGKLRHTMTSDTYLDTADGSLLLTRVPAMLLGPLTGQDVVMGGLSFTVRGKPALRLTYLEDTVMEDGWLTQRRFVTGTDGEQKAQYRKVADVKAGDKVIVVGLEGYNTTTKTSMHVEDLNLEKGDMLFTVVRFQGKQGYLPARKLRLGKLVHDALGEYSGLDQKVQQVPLARRTQDARKDGQGGGGVLDNLEQTQVTVDASSPPEPAPQQAGADDEQGLPLLKRRR